MYFLPPVDPAWTILRSGRRRFAIVQLAELARTGMGDRHPENCHNRVLSGRRSASSSSPSGWPRWLPKCARLLDSAARPLRQAGRVAAQTGPRTGSSQFPVISLLRPFAGIFFSLRCVLKIVQATELKGILIGANNLPVFQGIFTSGCRLARRRLGAGGRPRSRAIWRRR